MKNRIKQLRKEELKISQDKMADKLHISQNMITSYETGKTIPPDRVIADICREFNVSEEWLRTGKGDIYRQMTERELKIMKLEKALEGKSESLIHGLYCLADMEPEEIRLLIDIAFKIKEMNDSEEFRRRINKKRIEVEE